MLRFYCIVCGQVTCPESQLLCAAHNTAQHFQQYTTGRTPAQCCNFCGRLIERNFYFSFTHEACREQRAQEWQHSR